MSSLVQECSVMENDRGDGPVKLTKSQKKNKKKVVAATGDKMTSVSKTEDHTEVANGEMDSSLTTNQNPEVKVQKKIETAIGETGSGVNIGNTSSKKIKNQKLKNNNPASGDILSTRECTQEGSSTTKDLEVKSGESLCETTNLNVNDAGKRKKKPKSKNNGSTLGEIVNPQYLQKFEAANVEMGSGTTATDNALSEKKKKKKQKQKLKNTNPDSGEILSTCENIQDKVIAKKDSSITKAIEDVSGEKVLQGEEHEKDVNGKTGLNANKNLNVNDKGKKKKKPKGSTRSFIRRPTLGEILNPRYLELLEASNGETNNKKSAKKKRQDTIIMNKGSGTTKTEREDFQEIVNGEKSLSTIVDAESTMLRSIEGTQVANYEMGSTADLDIAEAKANKASSRKMYMEKKKKQKTEMNEITQVATLGKKLVIFDVNGLIADVVSPPPKDIKADKHFPRKAIFKRPFLDDFLCFCFERFNVGIWSSRTMKNLDPMVDFLLGDLKKKLLFLWDASKCTNTGFRTLEDKHKCVVLKDLRKIWNDNGPANSWVKGTFNESNTLLLDDSPYKALLNPKHTGIFPVSYSYKNRNDNFLGPQGELQTYLEGLAAADNVKTYVEQNPFGKRAIDETSLHWAFYSRVLKGQNM